MASPHLARLGAVVVAAVLSVAARSQEPALRGLDPIALCAGNEEQGQVEFATEHEGYVYRFASKDRLAKFHAKPERYSIQLGGACARMGPHSGRGEAKRFWVYKEHIYIFASDGCRAGFQKDPEACLGKRIPRPKAAGKPGFDAADRIAAAKKAHGLSTLPTFSFEVATTNGKTKTRRVFQVRDANSVRVDTEYRQGDQVWKYAKATSPKASFFIDEGDLRPMASAAQHEMRQVLWQEPIVALSRCEHAVRGGKKTIAGIDVTEVSVWIDGTLTHFGLDEKNLVRTARFLGRGPDFRFAEVTKIYDDLKDVGGVIVPHTVQTLLGGKKQTERRTKVTTGKAFAPGLFAPKK